MLKIFNRVLIFFWVFIVLQQVHADWIPLRLTVDNIIIGDINTNLNDQGQPIELRASELYIKLSPFLQNDKISRLRTLATEQDTLTLVNLAKVGIDSQYQENDLKLALNIPLEMRVVKDFPVLFAQNKTGLALYDKDFSGYLNLRGTIGYSDSSTPTTYTYAKKAGEGQIELVQNLSLFTLESTWQYLEHNVKPIQRNDTSLVTDFVDSKVRLRIGDFTPSGQPFQSTLSAGGIQVQKQFNIYPLKGSYNKSGAIIQVKRNSILEIYINDTLISRLRVAVGPYSLRDLPLVYGLNKVRVTLTDDLGLKETIEVDLLFDDQILAEGVNDFSYQAGRPSYYDLGEKKYADQSYSSFFHKYGFSNTVTGTVNHQNYLSYNLYGVGAGLLYSWGTNFVNLGYTTDTLYPSGTAASWRYSSPELSLPTFENFRVVFGSEFRSRHFRTIVLNDTVPSNFSEKYDVVLQKRLTERSSASIGLSKTVGQIFGSDEASGRLVYQNQFSQSWRFDATYAWTDKEADLNQILLTLNWLEPAGKAQATFTHDTANNATSMQVTKNNKYNFDDMNLSLNASKQKDRTSGVESQNFDLTSNYYAQKFESRFSYAGNSSNSNFNTTGTVGIGTAIAWTTQGFAISRPIYDSFAIVWADGLKDGQKLKIPNGLEKDTIEIGNHESFIFSNLNSYTERALHFDSTSLGTSSHLDREAYLLNPTYRSGLFVPLVVIKSLSVRGRLDSETKGLVQYASGRILDADGKVFSENFFTDESGNFLIDGLSYGKYQIVLADPKLKPVVFALEQETDNANDDGSEDVEASEFELGTIKVEKEDGT